jgi:hypothetical protein
MDIEPMDALKDIAMLSSGVAVAYFGLDRTIPWLPKIVHYGIAGGIVTYLAQIDTDKSLEKQPLAAIVALIIGMPLGIVGGEVTNYFL